MTYYLNIIVVIILLFVAPGKNSSNPLCDVGMEELSITDNDELIQLFYTDKVNRIDSLLKLSQRYYGFNGNVLVAHNGEVIFNKSYGYSNFAKKEALTDESVYQLASVSKQFTAVAILILKEKGKLKLDDDIRAYLPSLPYKGITIKNLLQHTGGLPNYMWMLEHNWESEDIPRNTDVIKMMSELDVPKYFSPGRRHDYSNTGYVVLASIIEKITGTSFADFVETNIFSPLGMNSSFIYSSAIDSVYPKRLEGYFKRWRRYRTYGESIHDGIVGDKGVYSTTTDLFLWDKALYDNTLISQDLTDEAFTAGKIRNRWKFKYGYGFRLKKYNNKDVVYHNGLWEGFRTSVTRFIEDKNTVIVLNNTSCRSIYFINNKIDEIANEQTDLVPEYQIIRTAIKYGYTFGYEKYSLLKNDNPDLKIDNQLFEKVVEKLQELDKNQLAFTIHKLSEDIRL